MSTDPIRAALERHLPHTVTGPLAVGDMRWLVECDEDTGRPEFRRVFRSGRFNKLFIEDARSCDSVRDEQVGKELTAFPNRTHALAALIDARTAWLELQHAELDALRAEVAALTEGEPK